LDVHVAPERDAIEAKIPERHVNLYVFVAASLGNLLGKGLEEAIQFRSSAAFLLLRLEFVLVAIAVLPLAVSGLIKLDIRGFSVELDIFCLLFVANDDGILEMNVNDDNQLVLARLEEKVADVGKQNVNTLLRAKRRLVANTILVNLDLSGHTLAFHRRPNKDIIQYGGTAI